MRPVIPFLIVIAIEAVLGALWGVFGGRGWQVQTGFEYATHGSMQFAIGSVCVQSIVLSQFGSFKTANWLLLNPFQRAAIKQLFLFGALTSVWEVTAKTSTQFESSLIVTLAIGAMIALLPFTGSPEARVPMGMVSQEEVNGVAEKPLTAISRLIFVIPCCIILITGKLNHLDVFMSVASYETVGLMAPSLICIDIILNKPRQAYVQMRDIPLFIGIAASFFAFVLTMKGGWSAKMSEFWQCLELIGPLYAIGLTCLAVLIKSAAEDSEPLELSAGIRS